MVSRTKQQSKNGSRFIEFKIPTNIIIKSILKKVSHVFLEESVLMLLRAVPKKVKIEFLIKLEKAPKKKSSKSKTKRKTPKKRKSSTKKRGKLRGKEKAAFLRRINKGRREAGLKPIKARR